MGDERYDIPPVFVWQGIITALLEIPMLVFSWLLAFKTTRRFVMKWFGINYTAGLMHAFIQICSLIITIIVVYSIGVEYIKQESPGTVEAYGEGKPATAGEITSAHYSLVVWPFMSADFYILIACALGYLYAFCKARSNDRTWHKYKDSIDPEAWLDYRESMINPEDLACSGAEGHHVPTATCWCKRETSPEEAQTQECWNASV